MKALTVKMKTVTQTGKRRQNVTHFVYYTYAINNRIFFLSDFWGVVLDLDKCIFP